MSYLEIILQFSTIIVAIANIILVFFVFLQIRDLRKPIILTKILTREQDVEEKPDVLVSDYPYLVIINCSNNVAKKFNISYRFSIKGHPTIHVNEPFLHHLNPKEAIKIVLKRQAIREAYPDLFESVSEGKITLLIPKETLRINLDVKIEYNPVFLSRFGYLIEDNYFIEWDSLKSFPQFKDHPRFDCWNKRNGEYYIYKLGKRAERKENLNPDDW